MLEKHLLDYDILRQLYVDRNMSINEIARRQGAHAGTIYNKLKQGTAKRGGAWPLRPPQPPARKESLVPVCGVAGFVEDLKWNHDVTYRALAKQAGVSEWTILRMVGPNPRVRRMERKTAKKIMSAVGHFERELRLKQNEEAVA